MLDSRTPQYTGDEVTQIVRRALNGKTLNDTVSYDDLVETARELGIDRTHLDAAIAAHESEQATDEARERWIRQRKSKFYGHLRAYLIVNTVLALMSIVGTGGYWFIWPLLGWGIGLAFDASNAFFPSEEEIDKGARKILKRERRHGMPAI